MTVTVRRGLPRVPGGEPWPAVENGAPTAAAPAPAPEPAAAPAPRVDPPEATVPEVAVPAAGSAADTTGLALRRGLPRTPGGEPWPPATIRPTDREPAASGARGGDPAASGLLDVELPAAIGPRPPLRVHTSVVPTAASARWSALRAERIGRERRPEPEVAASSRRAAVALVGGAAVAVAAGMTVLFTPWLVSTPAVAKFLTAYPGEYPLPETAPIGLPAWLGWQHFLNAFFLVLIVRSGLQVRHQKRPSAFWSPRRDPKRKISLTLWFHQALDVLWIANGAIFVVLLFLTGQWMRIVPTSWEVFPNAVSAALQYVSLDWPTENGWLNYNALQQLAYFAITFVAAPLAIVSGVRMSGVWPRDAARLNRAYPVEWARAVHYPVMLFFVAFTVVHVGLVLATGARRNLTHMYAAQDGDGWLGFVLFAASLAVIAAGWIAARPLVLAPIARLFGSVATR
ncbi:cytochrome b/b6 domain-containing protein [Microbacterium sp. 5K110]|uniref:cytochrome b/b6 domain-containing protein n=1 Tax=unclassified Microbacterium TaxID=2609290 RepID=UPI00207BA256|nr:cytochrome b/b6 domain-containing protein [Microbacterium sp. 5K110]